MVSANAASSPSSKDVALEITIKFLFFSDTEIWGSHKSSSTFQGTVTHPGFDRIDSWNDSQSSTGAEAYAHLKPLAGENLKRGKSVEARVQESMREFNLFDGCTMTWDVCDKLGKKCLVIELLLLPFTGLRDYVQAIHSPYWNRSFDEHEVILAEFVRTRQQKTHSLTR